MTIKQDINLSRFINLEILTKRITCLEKTGEKLGIEEGGVFSMTHNIVKIEVLHVTTNKNIEKIAFIATTNAGDHFISYDLEYDCYEVKLNYDSTFNSVYRNGNKASVRVNLKVQPDMINNQEISCPYFKGRFSVTEIHHF
ncbi:hypothetical protein [Endozoicomonas sp. Mp262]|uniref:hypothetical protein n=1 Tax=Endozoicomonas sp. Mp262 TaxID=2919499 RepID=UPI0021D82CCA